MWSERRAAGERRGQFLLPNTIFRSLLAKLNREFAPDHVLAQSVDIHAYNLGSAAQRRDVMILFYKT
jgi:hypothetical protein